MHPGMHEMLNYDFTVPLHLAVHYVMPSGSGQEGNWCL